MGSIKRALVSVSDKSGLIEFLKPLAEIGLEIVSTGGTAEFLKKNHFDVVDITEVTQFPEVLDGRVKTLHPFVHMGLLADQRNPKHIDQLQKHHVKAFDLVVGNLYPFEKAAQKLDVTNEELIENIDIGGPSFLRSAAKNYHSVVVVSDPEDYGWVQEKILNNELNELDRKRLAIKVFSLTSYYDSLIVQRLKDQEQELKYLNLPLKLKQPLRYGENAHQKASWFENPIQRSGLNEIEIFQGKELSYNNLLDLDAAFNLVSQFELPTCVAVKHNNPCGAATGKDLKSATEKAIASDPKSIFGGIVAFNKKVEVDVCELIKDLFLECVIAPDFSEQSLKFLSGKKNLRVLKAPLILSSVPVVKTISGGALFQESDQFRETEWKMISEIPTGELKQTIQFGEKVAGFLKSNSIAIVYRGQTIGLGMGQVNRVDAVEQALKRMDEFTQREKVNLAEVVLISDAFFPFPDSIDLISKKGIQWIAQPGGSIKDELVFEAARKNKMNMVITHTRHFRH